MLGNTASIEPLPGFLEHLQKLCDEYGIVLIVDEVKTGFRVAKGGAQELYGITPDLGTFSKSMGNGYPVAAFGGKREIMEQVGKGVGHAGTYNGNVVGMAAAEKTLEILSTTSALEDVAERGSSCRGESATFSKPEACHLLLRAIQACLVLLSQSHNPRISGIGQTATTTN